MWRTDFASRLTNDLLTVLYLLSVIISRYRPDTKLDACSCLAACHFIPAVIVVSVPLRMPS